MDHAAITICVTSVLYVVLATFARIKIEVKNRIGFLLLSYGALWLIITMLGELFTHWGSNNACSAYLGCVTGFMGYDAFEHFFFGVVAGAFVLWVGKWNERYAFTFADWRKTVFVLLSIATLVSVCWEILEFTHDAFRINVLGEHLFNLKLHLDMLDQPTNFDTMGDLIMNMYGVIVFAIIAWVVDPESLRARMKHA